MCSFGAGDYAGYCPALQAKQIDGLAFGAKWEVDNASTSDYCVGFHDSNHSDTWVCNKYVGDNPHSDYCADNYTVTSNYFAMGSVHSCRSSSSAYYGFGDCIWYGSHFGLQTDAVDNSFATKHAFRFVGAHENDHQRWASGDSIDLFFLDYENSAFTDNLGFVL